MDDAAHWQLLEPGELIHVDAGLQVTRRSGAAGPAATSAARRRVESRRSGLAAPDDSMTTRALVLGGGGVAGIAWETGILLGIADESPAAARALLESDVLLGTSAGSAVAAQLGSGSEFDGAVRAASRRSVRRNRPGCRNRPAVRAFPGRSVGSGGNPHPAPPAHRRGGAGRRDRDRAGPARGHRAAAALARLAASVHCGSPRSTSTPANWPCSTGIPAWTWSTRWPPVAPCPERGRR